MRKSVDFMFKSKHIWFPLKKKKIKKICKSSNCGNCVLKIEGTRYCVVNLHTIPPLTIMETIIDDCKKMTCEEIKSFKTEVVEKRKELIKLAKEGKI